MYSMYSMYSIEIEKLEFIIDNWDRIKRKSTLVLDEFYDKFNYDLDVGLGLCYNCDFCEIYEDIKVDMLDKFPKFSGNYAYPLGRSEFNSFNNFANNPDRLLLAKHCLHYLKNLDNV